MRNQVIWDLRDLHALNNYEYSFLITVESRGRLFTSAERAAADMKMSRNTFYKTRASLLGRGLLSAEERRIAGSGSQTTVYTVNASEVSRLLRAQGAPPEEDTPVSLPEDPGLISEGGRVLPDGTPSLPHVVAKEDTKLNMKTNPEDDREDDQGGVVLDQHGSVNSNHFAASLTMSWSELPLGSQLQSIEAIWNMNNEVDLAFRSVIETRLGTTDMDLETLTEAMKSDHTLVIALFDQIPAQFRRTATDQVQQAKVAVTDSSAVENPRLSDLKSKLDALHQQE